MPHHQDGAPHRSSTSGVATAAVDADASRRPLAGRPVWVISDGRAGIELPCIGIAERLGASIAVKRIAPARPWRWLAPWGPADPAARIGRPGSDFTAPWPAVAIASGRQAVPFIRAVRRASAGQTFTVFIQDPRRGASVADLICIPEHDRLRAANVLALATVPHGFSAERLAGLRAAPPPDLLALPRPRIGVILGGPNRVYRYGDDSLRRLAAGLTSLAALGAGLMITPSRRTPDYLLAAVDAATVSAARLLWRGEGDNPYPHFLANADALVVTGDSVNMVSEACATGRPVYVFEPEGGSPKFAAFHARLRDYGATRPMPERFERIDAWSYAPLDATVTIVREIERRWLARQAG